MSTGVFSSLPTEILTECFAHLGAPNLLALLSVSSRLRTIASQELLWEPHCENIYNKGSSEALGWRKLNKAELLPNEPEKPYHLIWRRLRLCEDYLGWWLSLEKAPAGIMMRIWLRNDTLVISHAIPRSDASVFGNNRGHIFALSWYNNTQNPLLIDCDSVTIEEYSVLNVRWLSEKPSRVMHHTHALRTFHASGLASTPTTELDTPESRWPSYDWPSHGSPSLFVAIRHAGISIDNEGYASALDVPTLAFPRAPGPRPFIALQSPFEITPDNPLLEDGVWIASYGHVHGCEFIHIQIRHITEADLTLPWGEEENLGQAFSPSLRDTRELLGLDSLPPSELTSEDVRVGDRIIEAVKVTGDTNVPRGVRTFVGFLDHKSAWSGARKGNDFIPRSASHPWPIHPESTVRRAAPVSALPATLAEMKEQDLPARGMTIPGLMRVADTGFVDPKWADATIHISGRREVRVMIQDGHHVTTFQKVDKDMFEIIR